MLKGPSLLSFDEVFDFIKVFVNDVLIHLDFRVSIEKIIIKKSAPKFISCFLMFKIKCQI
jgi:hypothetical protein